MFGFNLHNNSTRVKSEYMLLIEFGYNGNDGVLRGNFTCREGGVRFCVIVWSGECILVDFIKTVSKRSKKSMYPGLQEQERSKSMDCGATRTRTRTVMRKNKA